MSEPTANAETPDETPEPEEFLNRAARRARGKGKGHQHQHTEQSGGGAHGRGSVQSPRQYGNRRSG
ncbi:hypothetical protein AB0J83_01440 [Actinoplanes sp. NPDC049596]|uniref:hypothetical protein n=1 Tax=unclassified Actinoplanes TaxID=2626549 RepID=UPI00342D5272